MIDESGFVEIPLTVWRATWQAGALMLLATLVIMAFRRSITAEWRVLLWALPMCRLVILAVPESSWSMFNAFHMVTQMSQDGDGLVIKKELKPLVATPAVSGIQTHGTSTGAAIEASIVDPPASPQSTDVAEILVEPPLLTSGLWQRLLSGVLVGIWISGCCVLLIRWGVSRFALSRLLKSCQPIEDCMVVDMIAAFRRKHKVRRSIQCLVTNEHIGPATCGWIEPVILMPIRLLRDLRQDQVQFIIHHELEHVRRCDVLPLILSRVAVCMHWFNPFAWFAANRLRQNIELAADAATVAGFDEQQRESYGTLLVQLAQRSNGIPGLVLMADRRSNLRSRIGAIANPGRPGRIRSAFALTVVCVLFVTGLCDVATTQPGSAVASGMPTGSPDEKSDEVPVESGKYFVTGTVREKETSLPVADAEIQLLGPAVAGNDNRVITGKTDSAGKYRIAVPLGNVSMWMPRLKPGYWLLPDDSIKALVTSAEKPVVEYNIVAQRGAVWPVATNDYKQRPGTVSVTEEPDDIKRIAWLKGKPVSWSARPAQCISAIEKGGHGAFTQIGTSGKLVINVVVGNSETDYAGVLTELIVDADFDNTHVISADRLPDSELTVLKDVAGRKATIGKADVTLTDGVPTLAFKFEAEKPVAIQKLTGRVVDDSGKPIENVRIGLAMSERNAGGSDTGKSTATSADGRFNFEIPIQSRLTELEILFSAIITHDGFAGRDTREVGATKTYDPIDFGTIQLEQGHSLPVRVLNQTGDPVTGADIEPGGAYALRRQAVRSDAEGRAVLRNLPAGGVNVSTRYGDQSKNSILVVSDTDADNTETTIHLTMKTSTPLVSRQHPGPLPVGSVAPEWKLASWTDGKTRSLADFQGRIVVLEFWGLWCRPCVSLIPAMQKLHEQFSDRDVVFLGIHTADGDVEQINKLKNLHDWKTPCGLDFGTTIEEGETCRSYGVQAYPTIVIIDPSGKITFRSDAEPESEEAFMKEMEVLAKSLGIAWPLSEDGPEAETMAMVSKLLAARLSKEITRVLPE